MVLPEKVKVLVKGNLSIFFSYKLKVLVGIIGGIHKVELGLNSTLDLSEVSANRDDVYSSS